MKFLFKKNFARKLDSANKVFYQTIGKLKKIQAGITKTIEGNMVEIVKLEDENNELTDLLTKTENQIEEISKFIK